MSTNKQTASAANKKGSLPDSWINSRRKYIRVPQERRKYPRVDCDCPAIIAGYSGNVKVTDFSFGGCFVECEKSFSSKLAKGKMISLAIKFPTEDQILDFKVKVARTENRGMACEFMALKRQHVAALKSFFGFIRDIQPLF